MLTNEQINRAIAKQRGEDFVYGTAGRHTQRKKYPRRVDYCKDWAAAGPLLEDMAAKGYWPDLYALDDTGECWTLIWHEPKDYSISHEGEPYLPIETVARGYHAAFCKEE